MLSPISASATATATATAATLRQPCILSWQGNVRTGVPTLLYSTTFLTVRSSNGLTYDWLFNTEYLSLSTIELGIDPHLNDSLGPHSTSVKLRNFYRNMIIHDSILFD